MISQMKAGLRRTLVRTVLRVLDSDEIQTRLWEIVERPRDITARKACNIEDALFRKASVETADYVAERMPDISSYPNRDSLLEMALSRVTLDGLFLEFGVAEGDSINLIAERAPHEVHGFDSFEGLPEDWLDRTGAGHFSRQGNLPPVRDNVVLHKGWFDDTLPEFVGKHHGPVAFLHVDSDLYSSAKTIFTQLGDRIVPGTVIQFDEYFNYPGWRQHEFKAFQEYVTATGCAYDYIGYNRLGFSATVLVK